MKTQEVVPPVGEGMLSQLRDELRAQVVRAELAQPALPAPPAVAPPRMAEAEKSSGHAYAKRVDVRT